MSRRSHQRKPPKGYLPNETPWVDRALASSRHVLALAPSENWRPIPLYPVHREYGIGAYGAVLPTYDPRVVIKVTTDESETGLAFYLAQLLRAEEDPRASLLEPGALDGLVRFYRVESMGTQEFQDNARTITERLPMWMIWREAITPISGADKAHRSALTALNKFRADTFRYIWSQRDWFTMVAQMGRTPEELQRHLQVAVAERTRFVGVPIGSLAARAINSVGTSGPLMTTARLIVVYNDLVREHLAPVEDLWSIARSLLHLLRLGILICDAHWGNTGWAHREQDEEDTLVISDVGQAVSVVALPTPEPAPVPHTLKEQPWER